MVNKIVLIVIDNWFKSSGDESFANATGVNQGFAGIYAESLPEFFCIWIFLILSKKKYKIAKWLLLWKAIY